MLINSISASKKNNLNNAKVTFAGDKYAHTTDLEVKKILVDKYIHSEKLDLKLKKQISDELLVEKFEWETPTKPEGEKDAETKRTEMALSIISVGMYNIMNAIKRGAEKEQSNDLAAEVLTIISYLTGKEIEKEEKAMDVYPLSDDPPFGVKDLYVP